MPPLRRSKAAAEEEGIRTREKKRREICSHHHMPSAHMDLPSMASGIQSDSKLQLDAATQLFNLVSLENNPLISEVIQSGAIPRIVEFLKRDDYPQLQCIAVRVLKNIASGTSENTKVVIDCGAVPLLVKLLDSSELDTCEQVVWSLGNIAAESIRYRNIVLRCGALHPLLTLLEEHKSISFLRIGSWTLANIFEKIPKVPFEQLEFTSKVLASLLLTTDEVILKEACWALGYLSRCGGGIKATMYAAGVCHKLATVYGNAPQSVMFPALKAIGSIFSRTALDKRVAEVRHLITVATGKRDMLLAKCILNAASDVVGHAALALHLLYDESLAKEIEDAALKERKDSSSC